MIKELREKPHIKDNYFQYEDDLKVATYNKPIKYTPYSDNEHNALLGSKAVLSVEFKEKTDGRIVISNLSYLHFLFTQKLIEMGLRDELIVQYAQKFKKQILTREGVYSHLIEYYLVSVVNGEPVNFYILDGNILIAHQSEYELIKAKHNVYAGEIKISLNELYGYLRDEDIEPVKRIPMFEQEKYAKIVRELKNQDIIISNIEIRYKNDEPNRMEIEGTTKSRKDFDYLREYIEGFGEVTHIYSKGNVEGFKFKKTITLKKYD